jgi:hypothetical protein
MAKEELKEENNMKGKELKKITFKCQRCDKYKPIEEMKVIRRFFPILVVCQKCKEEIS